MTAPAPRGYPNRFSRLLLLAMQQVLGSFSTEALLRSAGLPTALPDDALDRIYPFAQVTALNRALLDIYGVTGGRALALEIGQRWFTGLASLGAFAAFNDPAFQRLSDARRMGIALQVLSEIFNRLTDQACQLESLPDTYRFIIVNSPMVYDGAPDPACHLLGGLLRGCLRAATGGRDYALRESECRAGGRDRCAFTISKRALATD